MNTIMVQMADEKWTLQALHLACALARNNQTDVTLVRMMAVQHISWLGSDLGTPELTDKEAKALRIYTDTAEDYGVALSVQPMQYMTLGDALVEVADLLNADVVFATLPESKIPYWHKFQAATLQRRLAAHHRQLYTIDQPLNTSDWVPSVTIRTAK